jgi:replicative DNA helicase
MNLDESGRRKLKGHQTGIEPIDEIISGFRPRGMTYLAARPGVGKTTLALQVALNASEHAAELGPAVFFSMEMHQEDLWPRFMAAATGADVDLLDQGTLDDGCLPEVLADLRQLCEKGALDFSFGSASVEDVERVIDKKARSYGLVIIDHAELILAPQGAGNRPQWEAKGLIVDQLRVLARESGWHIFVVGQLSGDADTSAAAMKHAKGTGKWSEACGVFAALEREEDQQVLRGCAPVKLTVLKNRYGRTGSARLQLDGSGQQFTAAEPIYNP